MGSRMKVLSRHIIFWTGLSLIAFFSPVFAIQPVDAVAPDFTERTTPSFPRAMKASPEMAKQISKINSVIVVFKDESVSKKDWRGKSALDKATNGVDDDNNGYIDDYLGIDLVNTDTYPMDDNLHGTHVAGTIAAEADNGYGIAGICPFAKILPIKIFTDDTHSAEQKGFYKIEVRVE